MTGGQSDLGLSFGAQAEAVDLSHLENVERPELMVLKASESELAAHEKRLKQIEEKAGGHSIWRDL